MAPSKRWLQLYFISILSVPSFALPYADIPHLDPSRRNYKPQPRCKPTLLGFVHPYPDPSKSTITITKQGQPVTTYIPTRTTCCDKTCRDLYSTSTYNWYSTWLPGPRGLQFVTNGDDTITLPPAACATCGPKHRLQSHYCSTNGVHTVNGQLHRVDDAPRYVYYAEETGYNYQVSDVNSYFQWLHNKTSGVTIDVKSVNCADGLCTQKVETWLKDQKVEKEVRSVTTEFKGCCEKPGACTLSAHIPGYGKMEIVVRVKSKGVVTRVSTQKLTRTKTQVVTSTITKKTITITKRKSTITKRRSKIATSNSRISSSCTLSQKPEIITGTSSEEVATVATSSSARIPTTTSSLAVPTPEISPEFLLAIDVEPPIRDRKVRRRGSRKPNPEYFVRIDNGNLTFSKYGWDGLKFSLSDGQLTANGGYLKAFIDASTTSILPRPESAPVRMGIPNPDDIIAKITSFYDGIQHVIVWDTRKIAVGTALAQFCIRKDLNGDSGQVFVFWDAVPPEGCSLVTLFIPTDFVPPLKPSPMTTRPISSASSLSPTSSSEARTSNSQLPVGLRLGEALSTLITALLPSRSSETTSSISIPTEASSASMSTGVSSATIPTDTSSMSIST